MPIKKGNTTIGAIYKGTTQIAKVYKGTKLLFENAAWLNYYFEYLYHDLIPTTLPKNIYNGTWESGTILQGNDYSSTTYIRTPDNDRISVVGGETYYLKGVNALTSANYYIFEYDTNGTWLDRLDKENANINNGLSFNLNANCKYVRLVVHKDTTNIQFYNKTLSVKNKLKLATIYGNSVVENQLCPALYDSTLSSGVVFTTSNDGRKATLSGTSSSYWTYTLSFGKTLPIGSVILISVKLTNPNNLMFGYRLREENITPMEYYGNSQLQIRTITSAINCIQFYGDPNSDYTGCEIEDVQVVCLTQRHPFDTPTTLTDNRVQAILNRGYIPYNSGELKSVDIGEFSSEPYNLFDEMLEQGNIPTSTGQNANGTQYRSKNYIKVVGGLFYTFEYNRSAIPNGSTYFYLYEYDEYHNYLGETMSGNSNSSISFTPKQQTSYVRFKLYNSTDFSGYTPTQAILQCCLHRTGTRTGYAPHTNPQTISFKYQGGGVGTSHDTMEIGKENVVFTKNVSRVDLGTIPWTIGSNGRARSGNYFSGKIKHWTGGYYSIPTTIICSKYSISAPNVMESQTPTNMTISIGGNEYEVCIYDSSLVNMTTEQIQQALSGVMLEYQLATPQVITIPRNKLGVVDLGSLNWEYATNNNGIKFFRTYGIQNSIVIGTLNQLQIYMSKYNLSPTINVAVATSKNFIDKTACQSIGGYSFNIRDDSFTNATDFKNAMSGIYLFYETQDEVADIIDTIGVEAGGTFTANWFSWVENQLTLYGDFSSSSGWYTIASSGSLSVANNIAKVEKISNAKVFLYRANADYPTLTNHKYLHTALVRTSHNATLRFTCGNSYMSIQSIIANTWTRISFIASPTTFSGFFSDIEDNNDLPIGGYFETREYEVIDLTIGFPNGDIPTSISDPRIQKILEMGYIPTNTTGTYKHVDCEVLPNVDTKIKGK